MEHDDLKRIEKHDSGDRGNDRRSELMSELELKKAEVERLEQFTNKLQQQIKEKEKEFAQRETDLKKHLEHVSFFLFYFCDTFP